MGWKQKTAWWQFFIINNEQLPWNVECATNWNVFYFESFFPPLTICCLWFIIATITRTYSPAHAHSEGIHGLRSVSPRSASSWRGSRFSSRAHWISTKPVDPALPWSMSQHGCSVPTHMVEFNAWAEFWICAAVIRPAVVTTRLNHWGDDAHPGQ